MLFLPDFFFALFGGKIQAGEVGALRGEQAEFFIRAARVAGQTAIRAHHPCDRG